MGPPKQGGPLPWALTVGTGLCCLRRPGKMDDIVWNIQGAREEGVGVAGEGDEGKQGGRGHARHKTFS